jgi:hypothetical protein
VTEALAALGFVQYRDVGAEVADQFRAWVGLSLPSDYLAFLAYREPPCMPLLYRLTRSGEDWEGCVAEFHNIAPHADGLADLARQVVQPASGTPMLPVGCDPGGNWLCLSLADGSVYDLDYGSGALSRVAPDFTSFVRQLRPNE